MTIEHLLRMELDKKQEEIDRIKMLLPVFVRQLKGLFEKGDEAVFCGYEVVISSVEKKWAVVTDCNNHHYNARVKDLRPKIIL